MSIRVFSTDELLAAINADPAKFLNVEKKKEDKAYKGTKFLNATVNVGTDVKKELWVKLENVPLGRGIADPEDENDKRNEFEGTRLQLETTVGRAGKFGQFMLKYDGVWKTKAAALIADGTIKADGRKVHELVQTKLSENNKTNPGGALEDPIIRLPLDFAPFPQKYYHKFLAGQPRTQIFDARTKYVDEQGRTQYKLAVVKNAAGQDELVTDKNVHKFITNNSTLVEGRFMIPSISVSQQWISMPGTVCRCVIEPGVDSGFSDEAPVAVANAPGAAPAVAAVQPATAAPVATPAAPAQPAPVAPAPVPVAAPAPAPVAPAAADDVANLIAGL